MAALVTTYGGKPIVAPALREVPLESNPEAIAFADALIRGEFDVVILLTGVGTRALLDVVQGAGKRDAFVAALGEDEGRPPGPEAAGGDARAGDRAVGHGARAEHVARAARGARRQPATSGLTGPQASAGAGVRRLESRSPHGLEARGARVTACRSIAGRCRKTSNRCAPRCRRSSRGERGRRDFHHRHAGRAPVPGGRDDAAGRRGARRRSAAWSLPPSVRPRARSCGSSGSRSISRRHTQRWASSSAKPPNTPPSSFAPNARKIG